MGGPAIARFPNLPVIFTSGYSESAASSRIQLRSSRYLQKPYSPTALARAVREILDAVHPQPCVSA
jgi:two-component system cell cycle sensor histidine kinase/response regulator CckA